MELNEKDPFFSISSLGRGDWKKWWVPLILCLPSQLFSYPTKRNRPSLLYFSLLKFTLSYFFSTKQRLRVCLVWFEFFQCHGYPRCFKPQHRSWFGDFTAIFERQRCWCKRASGVYWWERKRGNSQLFEEPLSCYQEPFIEVSKRKKKNVHKGFSSS